MPITIERQSVTKLVRPFAGIDRLDDLIPKMSAQDEATLCRLLSQLASSVDLSATLATDMVTSLDAALRSRTVLVTH